MDSVPKSLDLHLNRYENVILLGDFNGSIEDSFMKNFCENYDLKSLIKKPTCFKNPEKPSCIDLTLTNKPRSFIKTDVIETGLSDYHKLFFFENKKFMDNLNAEIITIILKKMA